MTIKYVIVDDRICRERWYLAQSSNNPYIDNFDGLFWTSWECFRACSMNGGYTLFNTREEAEEFIKNFVCDITYAKVIEVIWKG